MAILKIISHGKTNAGKRRVLQYVLDPKKTNPELCAVSGDFQSEEITPQTVYKSYALTRALFNKVSLGGRTYTHGTIAFAPGEISPEDAAEFAEEFVTKVYPSNQVLTAVHTDAEHIHAHFVIEPVSFVDGKMLHTSKRDLDRAKQVCNEMCRERGFSMAQKGRHADGVDFEEGEVTTWSKNKYHQMAQNPGQSYLIDLAAAVRDCTAVAESQEEFCSLMEHEYGWTVIWKEAKKNITFVNSENKRVRDSNLNKTFNMEISKEALQYEFARNSGRITGQRAASQAAAARDPNQTTGGREPMAERTTGSCGEINVWQLLRRWNRTTHRSF